METRRIVIIGGGITGLAAAQRLTENPKQINSNFEVLLLEAGERLGGVLRTTERDGFLIEHGADSFISEKPEGLDLVRRLGIEPRLTETNADHRRSFIVRRGRLRAVPEGFQLMAPSRFWPFVTTDIFSLSGKARMALELLIPRRSVANGTADESLAQFVRRRLGREAFERMAQPMIGGIYTADPEKLSLRATLPRFLEMEREHGSVIRALLKQSRSRGAGPAGPEASRKENHNSLLSGVSGARYSLFLSFDKGMQVLVDEVAARLPQEVVQLKTRVTAVSFDHGANLWKIVLGDNHTLLADALILAIPAYSAASLLRGSDNELARRLDQIEYASTATINVAFRREDVPHPLDGFGFVVPFIEKRSILACTFSSVKFAGRSPDTHVLIRAFIGGALQPELFELDEDEMVRRVREDLGTLLGIEQPPLFSVVEKWRRSMPQYHVGHLDLVSQIQSRARQLPGLYLAGNSYLGAGVPDCVRSGWQAASESVELVLR